MSDLLKRFMTVVARSDHVVFVDALSYVELSRSEEDELFAIASQIVADQELSGWLDLDAIRAGRASKDG